MTESAGKTHAAGILLSLLLGGCCCCPVGTKLGDQAVYMPPPITLNSPWVIEPDCVKKFTCPPPGMSW